MYPTIKKVPESIVTFTKTTKQEITFHDYHIIILDTKDYLNKGWSFSSASEFAHLLTMSEVIGKKVREQLISGGFVFAFCDELHTIRKEPAWSSEFFNISSYGWCPIELGVVNETGDTVSILGSNIGYLKPLFKQFDISEIKWEVYFSNKIENSKVLATNRAGYTISEEIPVGSGRLVILPKFKDRNKAIKIILNEIVPQIVFEEEMTVIPPWVSEYRPPIEEDTQITLRSIHTYKKLIYAKGRQLEKAVKFVFENLGFMVKEIEEKDMHDLELRLDAKSVIVEIKGHDKRQTRRNEILQLLGYVIGEDKKDRRVSVSNHEREKPLEKRSKEAFTEGAISTAKNNKIGLISTTELWNIALRLLEGKLDEEEIKNIQKKIMQNSGIIHF